MNFTTQINLVASTLRMDATQASINTLIGQWINQSGQEIWRYSDWYFSLDRQIVQTVLDKTAGTVSVNAAGTAVTGASTSFASSDVGSFIQFSTSNNWYKITAVASATSATIESPYAGSTNLSAGTYTIRKFFYSLNSSVEKLLTCRQTITPAIVEMVFYREFDIFRPNPISTGDPLIIYVFGVDSSGNIRFTPYPWPSTVENLEFRVKTNYTPLVLGSDVSSIPSTWHSTVMIEGALYRGWAYLSTGNAQDEARAGRSKKEFESSLQRMSQDSTVDESHHVIIGNRDMPSINIGPILPYKYGVS